jgi:hypothetical protein
MQRNFKFASKKRAAWKKFEMDARRGSSDIMECPEHSQLTMPLAIRIVIISMSSEEN